MIDFNDRFTGLMIGILLVLAFYGYFILFGKTRNQRFLTVIIGERKQKGVFGLVTARSASKEERSFYQEFTYQTGGEKNGQNNES